MKKNLIVTLADKNYINQAKQVFSSIYFNSGWRGDYMLLTNGLNEQDLQWFEKRGILVREFNELGQEIVGKQKHPPVVLGKMELFKPEFKKWESVLFLDADIIVRSSLDELTKVEGFGAVRAFGIDLKDQFIRTNTKLYRKLNREYSLKGYGFNTGVFVFNTSILQEDTYNKLLDIYEEYGELNSFGEEGTLNLFFYKKWKEFPAYYNLSVSYINEAYKLNFQAINGKILHFIGTKQGFCPPWDPTNSYYEEWAYNLEKAEEINCSKGFPLKLDTEHKEITFQYLKKRATKNSLKNLILILKTTVEQILGIFGAPIRIYLPRTYIQLKSIERKIRKKEKINKIFAVGLNKTGTISLNQAFKNLGLKSLHGGRVGVNSIKEKITIAQEQKKKLLSDFEEYDCFTDNPFWKYYKELDRQYPNSKFILNTRDINDWIASRIKHVEINKKLIKNGFSLRDNWLNINTEQWKKERREHHKDVLNYFKDRPEDLLVINICGGDGYEELCHFLDLPIYQKEPFPKDNIGDIRDKKIEERIQQLKNKN